MNFPGRKHDLQRRGMLPNEDVVPTSITSGNISKIYSHKIKKICFIIWQTQKLATTCIIKASFSGNEHVVHEDKRTV